MITRLNAVACRLLLLLAVLVVACGLAVLARRFTNACLLLVAFLAWWRGRRFFTGSDVHGSARVASLADAQHHGLLDGGGDGLILGATFPESPSKWAALGSLVSPSVRSDVAVRMVLAAFYSPGWYGGRFLRLKRFVHLATFAMTGAGKGVSVLIPNLLSYRGSCVVTDPKGELYNATAEHRKRCFSHRVYRLDPFGVCGPGGDRLNPFDYLNPGDDSFLDNCRDFANMLIIRKGTETDPFWDDTAELCLTAFTAFVCGCEPNPEHRHLGTVRGIASAKGSFAKAIEVMQQVEGNGGVIKRLGGLLTWLSGDTLNSVLAVFQRHTALFDSPLIAHHLAASTFDPMVLRTGRATVYLVLPPDKLQSHAALLRLWVGVIMRRITKRADESTQVLWLLDEAAHLGKLPAVEDAATLMRGMGIRLWLFYQSLDQLKTAFGDKANIVLGNIGTQQYFSVNDFTTADELSKRIGDATVASRSRQRGTSNSSPVGGNRKDGPPPGSVGSNDSETVSEIARRLLKPEEIMVLPEDTALIFHKNMSVLPVRLPRYFAAAEFKGRRCGRQRGLGLAASLMAGVTLLASLIFTSLTTSIGTPRMPSLPSLPAMKREGPAELDALSDDMLLMEIHRMQAPLSRQRRRRPVRPPIRDWELPLPPLPTPEELRRRDDSRHSFGGMIRN